MIKYRTQFGRIEKVDIERETEKCVIFKNGNRDSKASSWRCYHDTWDVAHEFLILKAEKKVNTLRLQLEKEKGSLEEIKRMTANAALPARRVLFEGSVMSKDEEC